MKVFFGTTQISFRMDVQAYEFYEGVKLYVGGEFYSIWLELTNNLQKRRLFIR
jgi:hypothetical protein